MSTSAGVTAEQVETALRAAFGGASIAVRDDSDAHAGHAGAGNGSHFSVRIVSPRFAGLTKVAQHRLVYDALRFLMDRGIHALAIESGVPPADGA